MAQQSQRTAMYCLDLRRTLGTYVREGGKRIEQYD